MRNRYARTVCLLGLSLMATSCYNNPETTMRHPGEGSAAFHRHPEVGPGTTAGGSTAGPQPAAREHQEATTEPAHTEAAPAAPAAEHPGAQKSGDHTPEAPAHDAEKH